MPLMGQRGLDLMMNVDVFSSDVSIECKNDMHYLHKKHHKVSLLIKRSFI